MDDGLKPAPVAIILGDGGIKAGFIAGAADEVLRSSALVQERLAYMSGASASVGNIVYYLAFGDKHPGHEMWTSVLSDPRFLNYEKLRDLYQAKPLYDLSFMIETIFKGKYPIDQDKVKNSPIRFYLPVQEGDRPHIKYITNGPPGSITRGQEIIPLENARDYDLYEVIKAASAAPFIYDDTVKLNGGDYMDAAAIEPFALDLPGYDQARIIIILTKGRSTIVRKIRYFLLAILYICLVFPFRKRRFKLHKYLQYGLKPLVMDRVLQQAFALERAGKAVLIVPEGPIGGLLDRSSETLNKTYRHGQEVARRKLAEIEAMLAK
jgi:predicted patatin/cPLA2 family phospholipase